MDPSMRSMRKWHADRLERGEDQSGVPLMTAATIKAACLRHDGYESPELNESLYLHFRGFMRIENLEPYTSVKALFLESNNLRRIEGVEHLSSLRALFLQQNALASIEGLSGLANLNTLNLSQNAIERIDAGALAGLPSLATIVLSKNRFQTAGDVEAILECPSITNVDLSSNDLEDESVVAVMAGLPHLACLALTGNPFVRTMRHYRKTALAAMPKLTHLDDRPVFEEERIAVTAWESGGAAAERDARKEYKAEQQRREKRQMEAYREWVERKRVERVEKLAALNAERADQGLEPLLALPPRSRVRYAAGDAASLDRASAAGDAAAAASEAGASDSDAAAPATEGGVAVVEQLAGGVVRDRSDRRIGVVPGAAEGITPEAAAMLKRIEAGTTGIVPPTAQPAPAPAQSPVGDDAGSGAGAATTAAVPQPCTAPPPQATSVPCDAVTGETRAESKEGAAAAVPAEELGTAAAVSAAAPRPDVTMSDEQNAVYQSLRLYSRRRGEEVPESTVAGDASSDAGGFSGAARASGSDAASVASDSTLWTSASAAAGSAAPSSKAAAAASVAATAGARGAGGHGAPGSSADPLWTPAIDRAMRKLVAAVKYDWPRAAAAIQKAIRTGKLAPPPGPVSAGLSLTRTASLFSSEAVRDRFAALAAVPTPATHTLAGAAPGAVAGSSASSALRRRVAAAGATTADTGVATAVALATAAEARKEEGVLGALRPPRVVVLPATDDALPLDRLLRGPHFELRSYSDHIRPGLLPSVTDFGPDEDGSGAARDGSRTRAVEAPAAAAAQAGDDDDEAGEAGIDTLGAAPMSRAEIIASLRRTRFATSAGGADVAHLGLGGSAWMGGAAAGAAEGTGSAALSGMLQTAPAAGASAGAGLDPGSISGSARAWSANSVTLAPAAAAAADGEGEDTASDTTMASQASATVVAPAGPAQGTRVDDRYRVIGLRGVAEQRRPSAPGTGDGDASGEEGDSASLTAASVATAASGEWVGGAGAGGCETGAAGGADSDLEAGVPADVDGMD